MENINKYKIIAVVFGILLLILGGYVSYAKYSEMQNKNIQTAYQIGVSDAVSALFNQTENCGIATIYLGNNSRQLADVACIKAAAQQT